MKQNYLTDCVYFFSIEEHGNLLVPDYLDKIKNFNLSSFFAQNQFQVNIFNEPFDKFSLYSLYPYIRNIQKNNLDIHPVYLNSFMIPVYDENDNLKGLAIHNSQSLNINNPIFSLMNHGVKDFQCYKLYQPLYPHSGWMIFTNNQFQEVSYDEVKYPFYSWAKNHNVSFDQEFFKEYLNLPVNQKSIFLSVPQFVSAFFIWADLLKEPNNITKLQLNSLCQPKTIFGLIDDESLINISYTSKFHEHKYS